MPVDRKPKDQPAAEAQYLDAEYAAPEGFNPEEEDGSRKQAGATPEGEPDPKLEALRKRILEERIDFLNQIENHCNYPIVNLVETTKKYEVLEAVMYGGQLPPQKPKKSFTANPMLMGFTLRWKFKEGKPNDFEISESYAVDLDVENKKYARFILKPGMKFPFSKNEWVVTPEQAEQFNAVGYLPEPVLSYKKDGEILSISVQKNAFDGRPRFVFNKVIAEAIRREFANRKSKEGKDVTPYFRGKNGVFFSISDEQIDALSEIRPVTLRKNSEGQSMSVTVIYDVNQGKIVPCFQTYEQYKAKKQDAENKQQREASRQLGTAHEQSATHAATQSHSK